MRRRRSIKIKPALLLLLLVSFRAGTLQASAQWDLENSHSTASLRGVEYAGNGTIWASGSNGTVLRSLDNGRLWQTCTTPPGAEKLDFRGIQAWDKDTAIVMSSGPGDQSRLYKTTDGCQTWKLLFTNPDNSGFWDTIKFTTEQRGWLLGDPVDGHFALLATFDGGMHWKPVHQAGLAEAKGEGGAFAASNSVLIPSLPLIFGTAHAWLYQGNSTCTMGLVQDDPKACLPLFDFIKTRLPIAHDTASSGIFSIAQSGQTAVAVGGDYASPDRGRDTAAYKQIAGTHWNAAQTPPHGYRSAVAYDKKLKLWITVGPNGTDISTDDGRNWRALKPSRDEPADADKNWNALSLPFAVGAHGRIGRLRSLTREQRAQSSAAP